MKNKTNIDKAEYFFEKGWGADCDDENPSCALYVSACEYYKKAIEDESRRSARWKRIAKLQRDIISNLQGESQ